MTTTEKKSTAPAPKPAAKTTRKAPARKAKVAAKAQTPALQAAPVQQKEEKPAVAAPAVSAEKVEKPVVAPETATTEKPAIEAKIELLSTQVQEGYNEMFEFGKEQMEKMFKFENIDAFKSVEDMMAFSKDNVDAFMKSSSIAAKGVQDVAALVADMARVSFDENVAASKKIMECKTPQEVAELQTELMKSGYDKMIENANRISEASTKIVEEAVKPLQARVEAGVEKVKAA